MVVVALCEVETSQLDESKEGRKKEKEKGREMRVTRKEGAANRIDQYFSLFLFLQFVSFSPYASQTKRGRSVCLHC